MSILKARLLAGFAAATMLLTVTAGPAMAEESSNEGNVSDVNSFITVGNDRDFDRDFDFDDDFEDGFFFVGEDFDFDDGFFFASEDIDFEDDDEIEFEDGFFFVEG